MKSEINFTEPYTSQFIRYDIEDINEGIEIYHGVLELFNETTYFYHNNLNDLEDYDENKQFTNVLDCIDLWEGNGYGIAQVMKGRY